MSDANDLLDPIGVHVVETTKVDIDKLLTKDYETAHIDFAILLVQTSYRKYVSEIKRTTPGELPSHMKQRALMYAKLDAQSWLHQHGKTLIERTTAYLVIEAQESGWFREDYFSWDTLNDFLANITDAQEAGTSDAWYWNTFATKVVPAAKHAGIEPGQLLSGTTTARKLRTMVTGYNQVEKAMKAETLTPEQGEEAIKAIIYLAADTRTTHLQMEESIREIMGAVVREPDPLQGYSVILADGRRVVMIETMNQVEHSLVENSLRNKVVISPVGIDVGVRWLSEALRLENLLRRTNERTEDTG